MQLIQLVDKRFGSLVVIRRAPEVERPRRRASDPQWLCRCDCGRTVTVRGAHLRDGLTVTCGNDCAIQRAELSRRSLRHGHAAKGLHRSATYVAWATMKARCGNSDNSHYANYGGRGIAVCERWRASFENFLADMGERPSSGHSIDRIDNDGNYEPWNCRWATRSEQIRNRRVTVMATYQGKRMPLISACELAGLSYSTVRERVRALGWSPEKALAVPIGRPGRPTKAMIASRP